MLLAGLAIFFVMIMAAGPAPMQAASQIAEILLGDKADAHGVVEKPQHRFTPTTAAIKGTAYIAGAEKGQKVTVELIYATQNLKVLTMNEDLSSAGEVTYAFAIAKPEKGWPKGDYKMVISTSDGATKDAFFQVR
jgi:predicted carbohydrate-binding protein with CBM5 and CBM33 domain